MTNPSRGFLLMLRDIPIKGLLVLGFLLAGLLPVMIGALVSFEVGRAELKKQAFRQLEAVRAIKTAQIERFFLERKSDAASLAADPALLAAYRELKDACERLAAPREGLLRGLDRGRFEAPEAYRRVHERHAAFLANYIHEKGYYDLLLLDEHGVACFSVMKEADFGAAHATEQSALGDAWRAVTAQGLPFITDTKLYAPSKGAPAQFVAAPIAAGGGVLVLQISLDSINAVMGERRGMGESGESYLVGPDRRMRTDSALSPGTHGVVRSFLGRPERNGVETLAVAAALSGRSGTTIVTGYRGERVLSAYAPVLVGTTRWAMLVEIEEREIDRQIDQALSGSFLLILIVSTAAVLLLAFLIAALIARHLQTLARHYTELTEAVLAGHFDARGEPALVGSDFMPLVRQTNALLDAFVSRLDILPVPVLMLSPKRHVLFLNSAAAALCARPREEMMGRSCCSIFRCEACDAQGVCPAAQAINEGRTTTGETTLSCAAGALPVAFTSSPLYHPDGRLLGAWQIFVDQSEARRMAGEKQRLESQLYRAQRLDALGTLSSGIAHDFNNILSTMLVYADLIDQDIAPDGLAHKTLEQMTLAIERAAELVRQMLIFSRKLEGQCLIFEVLPVLRDTLSLFAASLPGNVQMSFSAAEEAFIFEGDPTHLRQVLMNLLTNARDALEDKGGVIRVVLARVSAGPERHTALLPLGLGARNLLLLSVSDDGCGMDERTRERLFEPFFTTKAPGKGTGLGLAVVHGIVSSYGGALGVQSAVGAGTTIEVYLPQAMPEEARA